MITFQNDSSLPKLPVPKLQESADKIKQLIAPLVGRIIDAETYQKTCMALDDFTATEGAGTKLHQALEKWQQNLLKTNPAASWLRPLWDDMYLSYREELPLNMNYFLSLKNESWGGENALANVIQGITKTFLDLEQGLIPAETTKISFQAMDQLRSLIFTRIPIKNKDALLKPNYLNNAYATVVCSGNWFVLPLTDSSGGLASTAQIQDNIQNIRQQAQSLGKRNNIGALTTIKRDDAAKIREDLLEKIENRLAFQSLEQSIFVLCLDEKVLDTQSVQHNFLAGAAQNRWFDKSLQIIVTPDSQIGLNFEHSGCDASVWIYLFSYANKLIQGELDKKSGTAKCENTQSIFWNIPLPIKDRLDSYAENFASKVENIEIESLELKHLSRDEIKKLKSSPDAFVQICFQLAQYAVFGKLHSTYEAVSMRSYAQGRTECARPNTQEVLELALALQNQQNPESITELFKNAEKAHLERLKQCLNGNGVERYIYGLEQMFYIHKEQLEIKELPALFTDQGWKALKTNTLSTSGVATPSIAFFGFGPVEKNGYGIGYSIGIDALRLVISSFKNSSSSSKQFKNAFIEVSTKLHHILAP